ncbi:cell wall elongation regulator TseB-like domain-containing protein [Paenibacillus sp. KN14-4R]|uniref:cell wall elongation regulator TseB-like domain-containing protein n=1 Tax=Paenibacillus sp. KN14-4R TaxID=3445773 RepID=UPI003FA145EF
MSRVKKTVFISVIVLVTLVVIMYFFYTRVQQNHFTDLSQAVQTAYEKTTMVTATRAEPSYGDDAYNIVFGDDKLGHPLIAWVSTQGVHTEFADNIFSEKQVRAKMLEKGASINILRILPNKLQGQYVWEVFYKQAIPNESDKYFYDYYKITDGSLVDTYRLSLQ